VPFIVLAKTAVIDRDCISWPDFIDPSVERQPAFSNRLASLALQKFLPDDYAARVETICHQSG